jgi:hypothetical protein
MRRWLVIAAFALPATAQSQLAGASSAAEQIHPPLGARVRVRAEGIFGGLHTGTVLRRSGDTLILSSKGEDPVAVPLSRISSLETSRGKSRRRGMIRGTIVVGAVGALINLLDAKFGSDICSFPCSGPVAERSTEKRVTAEGLLKGATIGATFGALLGALSPQETWQRVDLSPRVSLGVAPRGVMTAGITFAMH